MLRSSVPQIPVLGALLASMNGNNQTTSPISPTVNNQGNNSISPNSRNRQGSVLAKKPSFGRKQSQHGSRSENSRSTSGKSKTQQQIKNFCEFIQFFCGLSTGRMSLHEVETVILEPIVVDEAHRMGNKLMEEFDKLLKIAQIDPQDWFEYVTRKKTQMQEFISYSEFSAEILKLCVDLQHPLIGDDDVQQLFHHIAGDRDDDCFEIFNLAMAFCKYRLPPSKVKMLNLVSAQLKELGEFFRSTNTHLKDLGGISSSSIATGLITSSELESIISTLVLRKELFFESDGDIGEGDALNTSNHSGGNNSKASTKMSAKSSQHSASSSKSITASTPPTMGVPVTKSKSNDNQEQQQEKVIVIPQKRRSSMMQSFIQSVQNVAVSISTKASNMRRSVVSIKPLNPHDFTPDATTQQQQQIQIQQQNKLKPQTLQSVTSPKVKAEMHEEFAKYLDVEEKRHLENVVKMLSGDAANNKKSPPKPSNNTEDTKVDDDDDDFENQRRHSIVRRYTVLTSAKLKPGEAPGSSKEVEYLEFEHDESDEDDDDMLAHYHPPHPHGHGQQHQGGEHDPQSHSTPVVTNNSPPPQLQRGMSRGLSQSNMIKSPKRNSTVANNNGFQKMLDSFTNRVDHVRRASTYYTKGGH